MIEFAKKGKGSSFKVSLKKLSKCVKLLPSDDEYTILKKYNYKKRINPLIITK